MKKCNTPVRLLLLALLVVAVVAAMTGTFFVFSLSLAAFNITGAPRGVLSAGIVVVSMIVGAIVAPIGDALGRVQQSPRGRYSKRYSAVGNAGMTRSHLPRARSLSQNLSALETIPPRAR